MKAYADTGLLCSLYAPDAHTAAAAARMKRAKEALPVTWLHQLELRNAMRLRVFRKEIGAAQKEASLNLFLADLASGVLAGASPKATDVEREAERLSASFSETLGTRSLDILHVAAALVLGAEEFWTFETRQAALAKACGLGVPAV
ncbi:MAG: PIN domain-containing protein [Burkholderiales bacterium]|nr:PIN domain-containing protein [Opitutaceae bacterium]